MAPKCSLVSLGLPLVNVRTEVNEKHSQYVAVVELRIVGRNRSNLLTWSREFNLATGNYDNFQNGFGINWPRLNLRQWHTDLLSDASLTFSTQVQVDFRSSRGPWPIREMSSKILLAYRTEFTHVHVHSPFPSIVYVDADCVLRLSRSSALPLVHR
eukprot:6214053-Pleurochrysis_carterae.AAC.4